MCVSSVLKVVFILCLTASLGLLLAGMFLPGWREVRLKGPELAAINSTDVKNIIPKDAIQNAKLNKGIIGSYCDPGAAKYRECLKKATANPSWETAALALFVAGTVVCFFAFVWSWVMCFACCCDRCLAPPLPTLTSLAAVLVGVGLVIYLNNFSKDNPLKDTALKDAFDEAELGSAAYLTICATVGLVGTSVVGCFLVKAIQTPLA